MSAPTVQEKRIAIPDYSRAKEYAWHASDRNWQQADVVTAGIDVGSTTSQAVIMTDGEIIAYSTLWDGADDPNSARQALDAALDGTGMKRNDIHYIVGTGCGVTNIPMAERSVSEIACHAKGANHGIGSSPRTVLAMGGRDCVVIDCKETGGVASFLTNACPPAYCRENLCNACGAAQGRGIEAVAEGLAIPIEEVGAMSLSVDEEVLVERLSVPFDEREKIRDEMLEEIGAEILAQGGASPLSGALGVVCAVLAKTQAAGLLRNGWSKAEILAAYCAALAHQAALLVKRMGVQEELVITGGVARNIGVVKRLERELGIKAVVMRPDPQIAAALGAALYARDLGER